MRISGLQKLSLLDYPGHLSCTVFTLGCNFRCPYCHNPELVDPEQFREVLSLDFVWDFLEDRKGFLDGICITGGEPTLQENLAAFIARSRSMGYKTKLDTNGSRPEVIKDLIDKGLLDYVAMDVKAPPEKYGEILCFSGDPSCIEESIGLLESSSVAHEFRTTVVPGIHHGEDLEKIGMMVEGSDLLFLQNFRPSKQLDPGMEQLKGFSKGILQEFRQILEKYVNKVEIRN
ncbi:MAG: anaerobic ribonucleoside-triphosphate reductase activating protein [Synergistales bacterium]|nr:anaerobic ribonucleoside-triphosphate reductase activating protein [Synergistales bacterium]